MKQQELLVPTDYFPPCPKTGCEHPARAWSMTRAGKRQSSASCKPDCYFRARVGANCEDLTHANCSGKFCGMPCECPCHKVTK